MLLFRPPLQKFGRAGVLPANFAALGDQPSPLTNDLPSLTGRASSEWLWALLSPLPGSGTTQVNDSGGYALVSPVDGTYTQGYRGLVMPPTGAPEAYDATITTTVGAGAPTYALTIDPSSSGSNAAGLALTYTAPGGGGGPATYTLSLAAATSGSNAAGLALSYTAPYVGTSTEPVTLAEAKLAARLNLAETELDPVVLGYISTARQIAEHETGRCFVQQTKRYTFSDWPAADHVMHVHSASAVAIQHWDGAAWQALAVEAFGWGEVDLGTGIAPAVGSSWPTLGAVAIGPRVRVDITAGSVTPTVDAPPCVKTFICACVSWWVDNPDEGAAASLQEAPRLMRLLDPVRLWGA